MPFSGHGGAGGVRLPTGAKTWDFHRLYWLCAVARRFGILIGVAEAARAPTASQLVRVSARTVPVRRSMRAFMRGTPRS